MSKWLEQLARETGVFGGHQFHGTQRVEHPGARVWPRFPMGVAHA